MPATPAEKSPTIDVRQMIAAYLAQSADRPAALVELLGMRRDDIEETGHQFEVARPVRIALRHAAALHRGDNGRAQHHFIGARRAIAVKPGENAVLAALVRCQADHGQQPEQPKVRAIGKSFHDRSVRVRGAGQIG